MLNSAMPHTLMDSSYTEAAEQAQQRGTPSDRIQPAANDRQQQQLALESEEMETNRISNTAAAAAPAASNRISQSAAILNMVQRPTVAFMPTDPEVRDRQLADQIALASKAKQQSAAQTDLAIEEMAPAAMPARLSASRIMRFEAQGSPSSISRTGSAHVLNKTRRKSLLRAQSRRLSPKAPPTLHTAPTAIAADGASQSGAGSTDVGASSGELVFAWPDVSVYTKPLLAVPLLQLSIQPTDTYSFAIASLAQECLQMAIRSVRYHQNTCGEASSLVKLTRGTHLEDQIVLRTLERSL